mmetsp:Transcript_20956/g.42772  ORF Transcript_20956/g.42772 Transcript_20956/m.42772 type:complete len:581 (+) Transcript_20956:356-2098(+)
MTLSFSFLLRIPTTRIMFHLGLVGDQSNCRSGNSFHSSCKQERPRRREDGERGGRPRGDGPPPVVRNERFAALAEEEKERNREREERRAARVETAASHGPPPEVKNSRFAAAAAAAEAERAERAERAPPRDFGGPPEPTNSRFSAAADYDRASRPPPRDMGPPPVQQNSRFAAAAAEFETERERENEERAQRFGGDRDRDDMGMGGPPGGRYGRGPPGRMDEGPPVPRNSRFAAAVAADEDYVPAERRAERDREEAEERGYGGPREGGGRFGGAGGFGGDHDDRGGGGGGYGDRRGGGYGDRRGGGYGGRPGYGDRDDRGPELPKGPAAARFEVRQEEFVVPAMKKKEPEPALPQVEAPLTLPGEDEAAAKARIEKKKREDEERAAAEKKAAEEAAAAQAAAEKEAAEAAAKAAAVEKDLLHEFASGNKQGDDLKTWCSEQGVLLPSVEKLVFHLLVETQSKNPDADCQWADPSKYGTALLSLVEENVAAMMEVLWGIQKFCDKEGFPKIGEEYLVQGMFRSMYKYDLADDEAFEFWKEDESDEHVTGKMKAIIQTMDWFAWLEEDDEESEEDYEEEEEE